MHLQSATPIAHKEQAAAVGDLCVIQLHRDCYKMCAQNTNITDLMKKGFFARKMLA
jgi:hypothetical protein